MTPLESWILIAILILLALGAAYVLTEMENRRQAKLNREELKRIVREEEEQ